MENIKKLFIKFLKCLRKKITNYLIKIEEISPPKFEQLATVAHISDQMLAEAKSAYDVILKYEKKMSQDIALAIYEKGLLTFSSYSDKETGNYVIRAEITIAKKD